MKILFIGDNFYPETNAAASRVYERARYWVKWGHDVTVITSAPNFPAGKLYEGHKNYWHQVEMIDGIRVVRVKTFISANKGFLLRIVDYLSFMATSFFAGLFEKRPDVVVATTPQFFAAISGYVLSLCKWRPFILEVSDLWPASIVAVGAMRESLLIRMLEKIELFLYRRAKAVVALTDAFKKDMISRGIDAAKIFVVRNGVELSQFQPQAADPNLMAQYNLENKFIVGYIGNFGMAQDLLSVLKAAKILKARAPGIKFLFVGDGGERGDLLSYADEHHLTNVVILPRQPKSEIARFWALSNLALVHLKNSEVFKTVIPSKIFESMAMGLPALVVLPKGEASDLLAENKNGLWIDAGDVERLAKTIEKLSMDPEQLKRYAKNGREAVKRYTREAQAKMMLDVLEHFC